MSTAADRARPVPVHKVLNNNVVIAIDDTGRERVLMGRGLGFGLKPDDLIDPAKVEKTFVLDGGAEGERERRLLVDVPYPIIEAVSRAVDSALAELDGAYAVVGGTIPLPLGSSGEVAPAGVNKGATILELLARLEIDPADAIAVGDNWNDVEMFEVCGLSIAMGNAPFEVQALADQVTTAVDADGIHRGFARNGLI